MQRVPNAKMKSAAARPAATAGAAPASFDWPLAYEAERFLRQRMDSFLHRNRAARLLARRMRDETGNDFFEWMDHLALAEEDEKPLRDHLRDRPARGPVQRISAAPQTDWGARASRPQPSASRRRPHSEMVHRKKDRSTSSASRRDADWLRPGRSRSCA
jgi:hypothetical protein